jgi:hypothetical protein
MRDKRGAYGGRKLEMKKKSKYRWRKDEVGKTELPEVCSLFVTQVKRPQIPPSRRALEFLRYYHLIQNWSPKSSCSRRVLCLAIVKSLFYQYLQALASDIDSPGTRVQETEPQWYHDERIFRSR